MNKKWKFFAPGVLLVAQTQQVAYADIQYSLGAAAATQQQPYYDGSDYEVIPVVSLEYNNFFIEGNQLGFFLLGDGNSINPWGVALLGQWRDQGFKSSDAVALNNMAEREPTFEVGLGLSISGTWGTLDLTHTGDSRDIHNGEATGLIYSCPVQYQQWIWIPFLSGEHLNTALANYYYGVLANESTQLRRFYQSGDAYQWSMGHTLEYRLSPHWRALQTFSVTHLDGTIADSPIVTRRDLATLSAGVIYAF